MNTSSGQINGNNSLEAQRNSLNGKKAAVTDDVDSEETGGSLGPLAKIRKYVKNNRDTLCCCRPMFYLTFVLVCLLAPPILFALSIVGFVLLLPVMPCLLVYGRYPDTKNDSRSLLGNIRSMYTQPAKVMVVFLMYPALIFVLVFGILAGALGLIAYYLGGFVYFIMICL